MSPHLLHIYGNIAIHIYGLCIAAGLTLGLILLKYDKKIQTLIDFDTLLSVISLAICAGVFGGRFLWMVETWGNYSIIEILSFWNPGYSILGAFLGALLTLWIALKHHTLSPLSILDRFAIYAPFSQAVGRLGCFFTGCCYGLQTHVAWAITYTDPSCLAPLNVSLHPTQLYSVGLGLIIGSILYCIQNNFNKTGQLTALYIIGAGFERFLVDFLRSNRTLISDSNFSRSQALALILMSIGCAIFYVATYAKRQRKHI
jgi:phosphatidylglycerol:prolipoprotein diacylglycerol transferase